MGTGEKTRAWAGPRGVLGPAGGLALMIGLVAGVLAAVSAPRWFIRAHPELLVSWPGGAVGFGVTCGVVVLAGGCGGWRLLAVEVRRARRSRRVLRGAGMVGCWAVAFAVTGVVLGAVPGKNCGSGSGCTALPGGGWALLAFLVTVVAVGTALHRARRVREERRVVAERERLRRLRKRGKGKSRAAGGSTRRVG